MLHFIELVIALSLILFISPQTPTDNIVVRKFFETDYFTGWREAKEFVKWITWFLIFLFLFLLIILNLQIF